MDARLTQITFIVTIINDLIVFKNYIVQISKFLKESRFTIMSDPSAIIRNTSEERAFAIKNILAPLLAVIIGTFMVLLDSTVVNVAVPTLVQYFDSPCIPFNGRSPHTRLHCPRSSLSRDGCRINFSPNGCFSYRSDCLQ